MVSSDPKNKPARTLLVWDSDDTPPDSNRTTILWRSFSETDNNRIVSIPTIVEEQADTLRARYLAWIYDLGESLISGKRIVDHLELRTGFSYWWMTSMAQKFNASGSSEIANAIKAFVLEGLISEQKPESLIVVTDNARLAEVLRKFCREKKLTFAWNTAQGSKKSKPLARRIYSIFPFPLQALIYLAAFVAKGFSFLLKKPRESTMRAEVCFIDVLVHLDKQAFKSGRFISNYWTSLIEKLSFMSIRINWLHNYFQQEPLSSFAQAEELLGRFNSIPRGNETHALLEKNLTPSVVWKTLKDYMKISWASTRLSLFSHCFHPAGSSLDFWPLFRDEWLDSLRGLEAMRNCLRLSLYEEALNNMPRQRTGVYILENQSWELSLLFAWKNAGHGKLIGTPHTNVRFWDLRYFYDPRSYIRSGKNDLPIPDLIAVNGPAAKNAYLEGGYPEPQITEVEALRFLHLLKNTPVTRPKKAYGTGLNVLVCGDFLADTNDKMLSWLAFATQSLPPETTYVLKPHPACPITLSDFPSETLTISHASLAELLPDCDVVFTSNTTSAAVDAYCSGLPVVQMLTANTLNMSPLRGLKGVSYVSTPQELASVLLHARQDDRITMEIFFYLDQKLPRWEKLLSLKDL